MTRDSRGAPRTSGRPEARARRPTAAPAAPAGEERSAGIVLGLLAVLMAGAFLLRIGTQAAGAKFYTDECFHAHVAQWIAAHHRLPGVMPELYSGFYFYYPP